ncbi:MAG: hypothetical protein IJ911_11655 [Salinivirgaceae bacterium]|nr:hypothetical protein [Salinivirgaceae bacterium]
MFLEERLNNILATVDKKYWLALALDECVDFISERTKTPSISYADIAAVIKQTDTIWRQFCDNSHLMSQPIRDAFTTLYINERILPHPVLGEFFKNK